MDVKKITTGQQDTMKNKDDFVGIAEDCRDITVVIWHATAEKDVNRQADPTFVSAIEDLRGWDCQLCTKIVF